MPVHQRRGRRSRRPRRGVARGRRRTRGRLGDGSGGCHSGQVRATAPARRRSSMPGWASRRRGASSASTAVSPSHPPSASSVTCGSGSIPRICARWTTAWPGRPATCTTSRAVRRRCACAHCSRAPNRPSTDRGLTARVGAELECTMLGARRQPRVGRTMVAVRHAHVAGPLRIPRRPRRRRRARGPEHRATPHRIRPRSARGLARPNHTRRRGGRRHPRAHRDRPGRCPPRAARSRSRRCPSSAKRATERTCICRWPTMRVRCSPAATARTACGPHGQSADRRCARRSAGSAWRVRRFGVVGIAPQARQLGRRGQVLGSGEPRGGGPVHRGDTGKSARRQRRTEDHRPEREPLPGGHGAPRQRTARDRPRPGAARRGGRQPFRVNARHRRRCRPTSAPRSRRWKPPRSPRNCSPPRSSKVLVAVRRHETHHLRRSAPGRNHPGAAAGLELLTHSRKETSMTTSTPAESDQLPHRRLPFWVALALSVALVGPTLAMSGNGQGLIGTVGKSIPLVFLIGLVGVSLVGYSFVRLTRHLNHAGSAYGLVGGTIGPRTGFFSGFAMLGAYCGVLHRHPGVDRGVHQRVHRTAAAGQRRTRTSCHGWWSSWWPRRSRSCWPAATSGCWPRSCSPSRAIGILAMIVLVIVIFARGGAPSTGIDFSRVLILRCWRLRVGGDQRCGRGVPVLGRVRGVRVDGRGDRQSRPQHSARAGRDAAPDRCAVRRRDVRSGHRFRHRPGRARRLPEFGKHVGRLGRYVCRPVVQLW